MITGLATGINRTEYRNASTCNFRTDTTRRLELHHVKTIDGAAMILKGNLMSSETLQVCTGDNAWQANVWTTFWHYAPWLHWLTIFICFVFAIGGSKKALLSGDEKKEKRYKNLQKIKCNLWTNQKRKKNMSIKGKKKPKKETHFVFCFMKSNKAELKLVRCRCCWLMLLFSRSKRWRTKFFLFLSITIGLCRKMFLLCSRFSCLDSTVVYLSTKNLEKWLNSWQKDRSW